MDVRPEILALILACAAVTALPRMIPLELLARITLPRWLVEWLGYVPIAVLGALLAIEVLMVEGRPALAGNPALAAILPALAVAALTRSLIGTVAAGVGAYWVLL